MGIGIGISPVFGRVVVGGALPAPANLTLTITGASKDVITATWDAVSGATDYEIEYSDDGVTYAPVDTTALLTYGVTSADYDIGAAIHYVRVRAVGGAWATAQVEGVLINTFALWKGASLNDSVGSNTLSQVGTVGFVPGKIGNAFDISAGNYPYIADSTPFGLGGSFTIAGWVYRDSAGSYWVFVDKGTNFPNELDYEILLPDSGVEFYLANGSGFTVAFEPTDLSTGAWYCIIATYNSATNAMTVSLNAGTRATATFSGSRYGSASPLRLGQKDYGGPENLDGKLNILMLSNRVWSLAQEARFYNSGSGIDPLP